MCSVACHSGGVCYATGIKGGLGGTEGSCYRGGTEGMAALVLSVTLVLNTCMHHNNNYLLHEVARLLVDQWNLISRILWTCIRDYPYASAVSQFADHHDINFFFEVSAKTGDGIDEAFTAFFKEIHRKVSLYMLGVYCPFSTISLLQAQPRSQDDAKPSNDSSESKCSC